MGGKQHSIKPVVLLIETDASDVFLMRRALAKLSYTGDLWVVGSATEARAYMKNAHPFTDTAYYRPPNLIVSDFRLERHTAVEFLTWLRDQPSLGEIPIAIISGVSKGANPEQLAQIRPIALIQKTGDVGLLAASLAPLLPGSRS